MLAVSLGIAAFAFWPVYQSPRYVIAAATAIVLGSLIAVLGAVWRWPGPVVLLASVDGVPRWSGCPSPCPRRPSRASSRPSMVSSTSSPGVALGWKQLLTITLPVGDYEALLVPAFFLLFVAAVVGLSVALRTRVGELAVFAPDRRVRGGDRVRPVGAEPARSTCRSRCSRCCCSGCCGSGGTGAAPRSGCCRAARRARRARSTGVVGFRTVVSAALILALASGAAVAAAAAIPPTADRTVLRTAIVQPFDPRDYVSPLAGLPLVLAARERRRGAHGCLGPARRRRHPARDPRHLRRRGVLGGQRRDHVGVRIVHARAIHLRPVAGRRRAGHGQRDHRRVLGRVGADDRQVRAGDVRGLPRRRAPRCVLLQRRHRHGRRDRRTRHRRLLHAHRGAADAARAQRARRARARAGLGAHAAERAGRARRAPRRVRARHRGRG